jgi:hypothetical protein
MPSENSNNTTQQQKPTESEQGKVIPKVVVVETYEVVQRSASEIKMQKK